MMDNMPPLLSALLPSNMTRLPPQLTSLHRPPLEQSGVQNRNNLEQSGAQNRNNLEQSGAKNQNNLEQSGAKNQNNLEQSGAQNQNNLRCRSDNEQSSVPEETRTKVEKSPFDMSSILGSIGSLQNVAALANVFKDNRPTDNPSNDQSKTSSRYVQCS
jgi:hypothetical protein